MINRIRNRHLFLSDILLLSLASYLSFVLRLEDYGLEEYGTGFIVFTLIILIVTPSVFYVMRLYSHYWQYASAEDVLLLSGGISIATIIATSLTLGLFWLDSMLVGIPRSIPFIFMLLAILATAGPRYTIRLARHVKRRVHSKSDAQLVLIVGAGSAGELMVRELQKNPQLNMKVIGFVDDDPHKLHARIHGVPVLGNRNHIAGIVEKHKIQKVIIAIPSAPGKTIRVIAQLCEHVGVKAQTVPAVYELLDGRVSVSKLRDIQIEDLLRRAPVQTDSAAVRALLHGRRVLVTGGGGSIGSELCRQVLNCRPSELVILGHGENSIFQIHNELLSTLAETQRHAASGRLHEAFSTCQLHPVIADIRFPERIAAVFERYQPEVVFHAAAHKHVPLMEMNPVEAITNNVLGTNNVLRAAQAVGVAHFVMISSDKAVRPTSVMGASKRVAELLVQQAAQQSGQPYMTVRFGNVLGSRGSVVLTFKQQIAAGGPVTVTHPEMQRFFMTIPEAVQLVLQAAALGAGGEVFMLEMGKPIKIVDLAHDMIKLSGLEVGRDIDIEYTGIRAGEKLYEELFILGEAYKSTNHEKLFIAVNDSNVVPPGLEHWLELLEIAAQREDKESIMEILCTLIPQHCFTLPETINSWTSVIPHKTDQPLLTRAIGADNALG